jgi:hypothetical protein
LGFGVSVGSEIVSGGTLMMGLGRDFLKGGELTDSASSSTGTEVLTYGIELTLLASITLMILKRVL